MIPADHITFDGDTAWWVWRANEAFDAETGEDYLNPLDRPCDTCDGKEPPWLPFGPGAVQTVCAARCIDGRHTFDIEVARCEHCWWHPDLRCPQHGSDIRISARTYRVSIVPGMVLPITEGLNCSERVAHICRNEPWSHTGWLHHAELTDDRRIETEFPVTMPSAAKPGMWAVLVRVAL